MVGRSPYRSFARRRATPGRPFSFGRGNAADAQREPRPSDLGAKAKKARVPAAQPTRFISARLMNGYEQKTLRHVGRRCMIGIYEGGRNRPLRTATLIVNVACLLTPREVLNRYFRLLMEAGSNNCRCAKGRLTTALARHSHTSSHRSMSARKGGAEHRGRRVETSRPTGALTSLVGRRPQRVQRATLCRTMARRSV